MPEQRMALAPHVDKRVAVEGVLEKISKDHHRPITVALVQDVVVTVGESQIDLGHMWIQHAENLVNVERYERIGFLARVGKRKRMNSEGGTEYIYNLMYPTAVEPKSGPALRIPSPRPPKTPEPTQRCEKTEPESPAPRQQQQDAVQLMKDLSELAQRAEGWKNLEMLVSLPLELLTEIATVAERAGGRNNLEAIVKMITRP